jgi:hypothetical protein
MSLPTKRARDVTPLLYFGEEEYPLDNPPPDGYQIVVLDGDDSSSDEDDYCCWRVRPGLTRKKRSTSPGMPIDIRSEPLSIATICIFGCGLVGYLSLCAGPNPLVIVAALITIAFTLFEAIHTMGNLAHAHLATDQGAQWERRLVAPRRT